MTDQTRQASGAQAFWALARRQHGVVTRRQLLALGFTAHAIKHRVAKGRLHPVSRGVYAVGRPGLTQHGIWMAAILRGGPEAVLSHGSAAQLLEIRTRAGGPVEVSVPARSGRRVPGIVLHRRARLDPEDTIRRHGIPTTSPICTLIDLASPLSPSDLEAAVNEADKQGLCDPETLRLALDEYSRRPGVAKLRTLLDNRTFTLTDSELERRFLPLARGAGLPQPVTGHRLNGYKVDFYWPELGLVVETDGLRYHRTTAQQATDRLRDQTHAAAGLTPLRFTYAQVAFDSDRVRTTLMSVADRLRRQRGSTDPGRSA